MIVLRNKCFALGEEEKKGLSQNTKRNLKTAGYVGAAGLGGLSMYHTSKKTALNLAKAGKISPEILKRNIKVGRNAGIGLAAIGTGAALANHFISKKKENKN
jgi:hypothetical protein